MYAVCKCANEVEAFRYRFLNGRVVLFDHIDTAFTYLNQETELFKVVNVPLLGSIQEYVETAEKLPGNRRNILPVPWEMTYFSVRLCPGSPIRIFQFLLLLFVYLCLANFSFQNNIPHFRNSCNPKELWLYWRFSLWLNKWFYKEIWQKQSTQQTAIRSQLRCR